MVSWSLEPKRNRKVLELAPKSKGDGRECKRSQGLNEILACSIAVICKSFRFGGSETFVKENYNPESYPLPPVKPALFS